MLHDSFYLDQYDEYGTAWDGRKGPLVVSLLAITFLIVATIAVWLQ